MDVIDRLGLGLIFCLRVRVKVRVALELGLAVGSAFTCTTPHPYFMNRLAEMCGHICRQSC